MTSHGSDRTRTTLSPTRRHGVAVTTVLERLATIDIPGDPAQVSTVRQHLADLLGPAHRWSDPLAIATGELLANAIQHSDSGRGGCVHIEVTKNQDVLRVAVTDDGGATSRPRLHQGDLFAEGGRGLAIVQDLTARWEFEDSGAGLTVWFELDLECVEVPAAPRLAPPPGGWEEVGGRSSPPPASIS